MRWLTLILLLSCRALPLAAADVVPMAKDNKPQPTASESKVEPQFRDRVWAFALTGKRYAWKSSDTNELLGNVAEVQIANGYLQRSWYLLGSLDIILGPYETTRKRQVEVDYYGTGFTAWWAFSTQVGDLRSTDDGYGFALGLNYADIVGRNGGRTRKAAANGDQIKVYQMRVTGVSVMPALFFSWLEKGRPKGSSPELLSTRIEGYVLLAGLQIPMHAPFKVKYDYVDGDGNEQTVKEKGKFHGYSVLISLQTLLGI